MGDEMNGPRGEPDGESGGGSGGSSGGLNAPDTETRKPVSEEIGWRGRALQAESKLADLEKALAELRSTLEQTRDALESNERRREIERAVSAAGAIDTETVLMLVEAAMTGREPKDLSAVIEEIRRNKPFLFEPRGKNASDKASAGVMSPEPSRGGEALAALAEEARASGDRRALLRYLQARRQ